MSCSDSDEDWKNSSSLFRRRFRHRRRPQILRSLKIARTRGTIGPLSYNAFKMAPGFRGILELSRTLFNVYKIADMLQQISPFVRPFPLPIVSRAFFFSLSPASLRHEQAAAQERDTSKKRPWAYMWTIITDEFERNNRYLDFDILSIKQMVCSLSQSFLSYLLLWSFALSVPGIVSKVLSNVSRHI